METLTKIFFETANELGWQKILAALIIFFLGHFPIRILVSGFSGIFADVSSRQSRFVFRKFFSYGLHLFLIIGVLKIAGVNTKFILGAAGILTVALGFAARPSVSNLISGLLLIFEQPFVVGDLVRVDGQLGEVLSIDLLSSSLRTIDNLLVRVPNDALMNKMVVNYTRFPILRMDMHINVPYSESLAVIHKLLNEVRQKSPLSLQEPEALFKVESFEENHIVVIYSVWTPQRYLSEFKGEFYKEIHEAFRSAGVSQPQSSIRMTQETYPKSGGPSVSGPLQASNPSLPR